MKNKHLFLALEKSGNFMWKTQKKGHVIMTAETKSQNASEVMQISAI